MWNILSQKAKKLSEISLCQKLQESAEKFPPDQRWDNLASKRIISVTD